MKLLFWAGVVILVLGMVSLFIPIPRTEKHGVSAGDISIGVQTHTEEKVSPVVSGILIAGGILMMISSRARPKV